MNDTGIKDKLLMLGFTRRELKLIWHWSEKESLPMLDIISQLRKRFIGGVFLRILIVMFCVVSTTNESSGALFGGIFTFILAFVIVEIFAPFKIGAKIFINYRKIKD